MLTLIFGGTFDPVHAGHLALANAAARQLNAIVRLLPARQPPHRPAPVASPEQRLTMLRLAAGDQFNITIDDRELQRSGPSYTYDTLRELRAELGPDAPLGLLLGFDAFLGLPSWHRWRELFDLAHVIVATRPGYDAAGFAASLADEVAARRVLAAAALHSRPAGGIFFLSIPPHPASASEIRRRLAEGHSVEDWLPPSVADYIRTQHLYAD